MPTAKATARVPDPQLRSALDLLWAAHPAPQALYLRGSAALQAPPHRPWDIDVVLLVAPGHRAAARLRATCLEIRSRAPDLPPIDLVCCSFDALLDEPTLFPTCVQLRFLAVCVRGPDLVAGLDLPPPGPALAARLASPLSALVDTKLARLRRIRPGDPSLDARARSLAKAALRLAVVPALRVAPRYFRDPGTCAAWIAAHAPALEPDARRLLRGVAAATPDVASVVDAAERVRVELLP